MSFNLLEVLGCTIDAASGVPDLRKQRERIGCYFGFAVVVSVALILFLVSLI